jgi:hypothetical protein
VFLLIVLGILMFIIATTSFTMHCIQRRRRDRLRRRIQSGELDLEQLGVKRLTVPRRVLEEMPLYTYPPEKGDPAQRLEAEPGSEAVRTADEPVQQVNATEKDGAATATATATPQTAFLQPTCAICLDDFGAEESVVRELPCRHIFHAACVDAFLRENSSLCPLCKTSVLPKGYCPPVITNAMVRRERMLRRMRDGGPEDDGRRRRRGMGIAGRPREWVAGAGALWARGRPEGRRRDDAAAAPTPADAPGPAVEMRPAGAAAAAPGPAAEMRPAGAAAPAAGAPATEAPQTTELYGAEVEEQQREHPARAANPDVVAEAVDEQERRRPAWRKAVGMVFPGAV